MVNFLLNISMKNIIGANAISGKAAVVLPEESPVSGGDDFVLVKSIVRGTAVKANVPVSLGFAGFRTDVPSLSVNDAI